MSLANLLNIGGALGVVRATNKKQLLTVLSERIAHGLHLDERVVFEALLQRERLGSTGVGFGVAIPHAKLPDAQDVYGFFAKLEKPIDYEAIDDEPVDLVFVLIAPENAGADHLRALARVARQLREPMLTAKLRGTEDAEGQYAILTAKAQPNAA